jgi:hypothetical protein
MVHAGTDLDGGKTVWAHDPHLDPVLNFDPARAGIERLSDDALASGEAPPHPKSTTQIEVVPDRAHLELRWPNVQRVPDLRRCLEAL